MNEVTDETTNERTEKGKDGETEKWTNGGGMEGGTRKVVKMDGGVGRAGRLAAELTGGWGQARTYTPTDGRTNK